MEYKKPIIKTLIALALAALCVGLVVKNRLPVGAPYLGLQLLGIAGLLVLLYLYNRAFK